MFSDLPKNRERNSFFLIHKTHKKNSKPVNIVQQSQNRKKMDRHVFFGFVIPQIYIHWYKIVMLGCQLMLIYRHKPIHSIDQKLDLQHFLLRNESEYCWMLKLSASKFRAAFVSLLRLWVHIAIIDFPRLPQFRRYLH